MHACKEYLTVSRLPLCYLFDLTFWLILKLNSIPSLPYNLSRTNYNYSVRKLNICSFYNYATMQIFFKFRKHTNIIYVDINYKSTIFFLSWLSSKWRILSQLKLQFVCLVLVKVWLLLSSSHPHYIHPPSSSSSAAALSSSRFSHHIILISSSSMNLFVCISLVTRLLSCNSHMNILALLQQWLAATTAARVYDSFICFSSSLVKVFKYLLKHALCMCVWEWWCRCLRV